MTPHHDELRARLARIDPMPASAPVDLPTRPRAQEILERAMHTTDTTPTTATDAAGQPAWRRPALLATAAAAVIALAVGGALSLSDSGSQSPAKKAGTTLALKTQDSGGGVSLGSCLPFNIDVLRGVPLAFGGTVTQVREGSVQIAVDHWYKGVSADIVTVATPPANTSVGTADFTQGKRYLVTATNGTVNVCGLTGEATPELTQAFNQAFGP